MRVYADVQDVSASGEDASCYELRVDLSVLRESLFSPGERVPGLWEWFTDARERFISAIGGDLGALKNDDADAELHYWRGDDPDVCEADEFLLSLACEELFSVPLVLRPYLPTGEKERKRAIKKQNRRHLSEGADAMYEGLRGRLRAALHRSERDAQRWHTSVYLPRSRQTLLNRARDVFSAAEWTPGRVRAVENGVLFAVDIGYRRPPVGKVQHRLDVVASVLPSAEARRTFVYPRPIKTGQLTELLVRPRRLLPRRP